MSSKTYVAESLEDIAKLFDRCAETEEAQAEIRVKQRIKNQGAARAYRDAARTLRDTKLVPKTEKEKSDG